jgi:hypothetical protein
LTKGHVSCVQTKYIPEASFRKEAQREMIIFSLSFLFSSDLLDLKEVVRLKSHADLGLRT